MHRRPIILATVFFLASIGASAQDVEIPTPIKPVLVVFPQEVLATFRGKERIDLFLEVDKNGNVKDVVVFGPWLTCGKNDETVEALQKAAIEIAKKVIFSPAIRNGKPVDGYTTMSYSLAGTMAEPPPFNPKDVRSGGVVNGRSLIKPIPKYPSKARKLGIQSQVTILLLLDEEGKPISAKARSGHPLLLASAAQAACEARWTPTLFAGAPVKVGASVTYNFIP